MPRKKKEECKKMPGWLISFGDLMSLLLTFFILLFSMGTISLEKFHMVIKGVTESLGGRKIYLEQKLLNQSNVPLEFPDMYPKIKRKKKLLRSLSEIQNRLQKEGIEAEIIQHGSIIRFRLNTDRFFPPGSATPYPQAIPLIFDICRKMKEARFTVIIEGHTDNTPIRSGRFRSNLELSAERALSVLKMFLQCGYPENLLAARGYGPYRPIAPNDTPENRAKNRRVEFVIDAS
ncbi:flagellar motor protein MotB [Persephonella atlantica]|uniref:Flagellar motor protein MotB n=1 Tax=Persephonella atlantica TaxID=2699429 RepID=A0ABS1GJZ0_9AQUI|nr:flagellar motor protein MotB [Persephonella atlantica]MBK3333150.1 flagellar motor protein MotB [Persephonella atlantica]